MLLPDTTDFASYGTLLQNASPIANPLTDIDAAKLNAIQADCSAMTGTAIRAWALVTLAATTNAMAIAAHGSNWGASLAVKPVPARTSIGLFTLTFPVSVTDALSVVHTLNLRAGPAPNVMSSTLYFARIVSVVANVVTFQVWNSAGALNDAAGINIFLSVL